MAENSKRVVLIVVLLSILPSAVAAARRLGPSRVISAVGSLPPINFEDLSNPPAQTTWNVPDYPAIGAMRDVGLHTLRLCETEFDGLEGTVYGLVPGQEYGMIFIRDTSTMMPVLQYFYGDRYLRTPIEEFLRRQYGSEAASADGDIPGDGAISGVVAADGHVDKATVVSDEETHLIHAAYQYYRAVGGTEWLQKELSGNTVIARLNRALEWLYIHRFDDGYQLIKRGHTTDWGDIKFEPGPNPTDLDPDTNHWTCSTYDQALTYRALLDLAEMNQAVGDAARAHELKARAEQLRRSADEKLWDSARGSYLLHLHLTPLVHDFPEEEMIGISNALAAHWGLSDPSRTQRLFSCLEDARLAAGARKPGLSLHPPYPEAFFGAEQMSPGEYQNGALWDWWGGMQITAEFETGFSAMALAHLRMVAQDWASHPTEVFEWQMPSTGKGWGSHNYASAAGTMTQAIVRGLFGVTIERDRARVLPRLRKHDGEIRAFQPSTGLYVSYDYTYGQDSIVLDYGSNHLRSLEVRLLLPLGHETERVSIDGAQVPHRKETLLQDSYCAFEAPSGVHRAIVSLQAH